ncbi:MAG TPA: hypothetical protein VF233_06845 [Nitrososphaeraceae archaeon]
MNQTVWAVAKDRISAINNNNGNTASSCNLCNNRLAEISQEYGDYCLHCCQEYIHPAV